MPIRTRLRRVGIAAALLLALPAAGLGWLVFSESGLRFALDRAGALSGGRLTVANARGALARAMTFDRLAYVAGDTDIEAAGVRVHLSTRDLLRGVVVLDPLHIDRVTVQLPAADAAATKEPADTAAAPTDLALPLGLRVGADIGTLQVMRDGAAVLRLDAVRLRYAGGGERHRLDALQADSRWGRIGAAGSLAAARPFPLNVALALSSGRDDAVPLAGTARLHLHGSLHALRATGVARSDTGALHARAQAALAPLAQAGPAIVESLRLQVEALDLAALAPTLPRTRIAAEAAVTGQGGRLAGTLRATNAEPDPLDRQRLPIASLAARFATDLDTIELHDLAIDLAPGGRLTGGGKLQSDPLGARLTLRSHDLDLRALRSTLRQTALDGEARIEVLGPQHQRFSGRLAQRGIELRADGERNGDQVTLRDARLAAWGGSVSGSGQLVLGTPPRFDASLRFAGFDPARLGAYPAGSLNGEAQVDGALGEPRRIDANWTTADSVLRGQRLLSRGSARVIGTRIAHVDATAVLGRNRATARGAFGAQGDQLQWQVDAPALGQLAADLGGRVTGRGTLAGSLSDPRLSVRADAASLRLPGDVGVDRLRIEGAIGLAPDAALDLTLRAGGVRAAGRDVDALRLQTGGRAASHTAELHAQSGPTRFDARLRGGWQRGAGPWGRWSGTVQALTLQLPPAAGDERIALRLAAPAPLDLASDRIEVGAADFALGDGRLHIASLRWQPDGFATRGRFASLPARWLLALAPATGELRTTVRLAGDWSLRAAPRLDGQLSVRRTDGDVQLSAQPVIDAGLREAQLEARFDDGRVRATLAAQARVGSVSAQATLAPVAGAGGLGLTADSPLDFTARLSIGEIQGLTEPLQTVARVSGRVAADVQGSGTLGRPQLGGELRADDIGIDYPPYGVYLRDGVLRARLRGDTVQVERLAIRGGDGRLTANGALPLRAAVEDGALAWRAEAFRLMHRPDLRLVVSGDGRVGFSDGVPFLRGELRVDRGRIETARQQLPEIGEDVVVLGREEAAPAERAGLPLRLDLQLDLGDDLQVRLRGLRGELTGKLQLTTDAAGALRARGRVQAVDARYRAYGQELEVDPGVLVFDGPLDNPTLEIRAWRRNQAVEAGVQITGAAQAPRVSLLSEPQVPQGERLSWLVLGRAPGDAEGADIALLQAAAGALLADDDAVPLTQRIAGSLGLDELAIRGSREIESRVVAIGKRLSDDLYVTFERGIGAAAESLVKLDYTLTRRISLRAEAGTATGFGIFYRFAWD